MSVWVRPASVTEALSRSEYRSDGREKVTGRMQYTADLVRSDGLWAAFVQSPHAHAKITAIDVSAALRIEGVRCVLTADDIGRPHFGRSFCDWPVLAFGTVRFVGDRVVAVAAETRAAAYAAAEAVTVRYEPLPAVLDTVAALKPDAPVVHPDPQGYERLFPSPPAQAPRTHPNMYGALTITKGSPDIEAIFARAFRVFEHDFETPRHHPGFIEPRATIVWIEHGVVHVHTPNKVPFAFRREFAHAARLPEEQVVIEPSAIGGDFGGKGMAADELPCYFLARATGRAVQYVANYTEELRRGPTRHRTSLKLRTAVDRDGTFLAHVSTVHYDGGAYAAAKMMPSLLPGNAYGSVPYRVPNVRVDVFGVYTNTLPAAHVRSPADVQTFTAWEQHIDLIARAFETDPIAFRLKNVVRDGDALFSGEIMVRPMASAVLETLRRELRPLPPGTAYGRGIAIACNHMGSGNTALRLRLNRNGRITVLAAAVDQGSGAATVVQRVVAATLGIEPGHIVVQRANTAEALADPGCGHVRVTHIVGRAAVDGAEQLHSRLEAVRRQPQETFAELAERACTDAPLEVTGTFLTDHGPQVPGDMPFGACAIDIEVDRETGQVTVRDVLLVADVGQIINPVAHQGQIEGAFVFGLGAAMTEEFVIDADGRVTTLSLADYKLPSIRDVPPVRTVLIPGPAGDGPYGARAIGELFNIGIAAAMMNAVDDAVGVRLRRLPVRAEDIHAALDLRARTARPPFP